MKIKMITRQLGASDGIHVLNYVAGCEYEVSDKLAKVFITNGWAAEVKAEVTPIEKPVEKVEVKKPVFGDNNYAAELKKGARR